MIIIGLPGFGQDDTQREAAEWAARMEADFRAHQPQQPLMRWTPAMDATPRPHHYRTPTR